MRSWFSSSSSSFSRQRALTLASTCARFQRSLPSSDGIVGLRISRGADRPAEPADPESWWHTTFRSLPTTSATRQPGPSGPPCDQSDSAGGQFGQSSTANQPAMPAPLHRGGRRRREILLSEHARRPRHGATAATGRPLHPRPVRHENGPSVDYSPRQRPRHGHPDGTFSSGRTVGKAAKTATRRSPGGPLPPQSVKIRAASP